jgi:hypothetical protein
MEVMSTLTTVLVSALVSGGVAVGLEMVAKPRLEARKDRILAASKGRADFERRLLRLEIVCGLWETFEYPSGISMKGRQLIASEKKRSFSQVEDITRGLVDDLGFYALTYLGVNLPGLKASTPELISRYVFAVRAISLSSRPPEVKARSIRPLTEAIRLALFGSKWHLRARINALHRLPGLLREVSAWDDSVTPQDERN